ncbi:MAG: rhodanese-like domain-containing protein [Rhizobiales bacterium]|nr:rhodanese-like domain-containing protein [Hyphomicrobiales bacterium]
MPRTITLEDLLERLDAMPRPVLIEALPERYYRDGHLPGALHMPHDEVGRLAMQAVPDKSAEIVVYCASAACRNSHIAAATLEGLGYLDVSIYAGGKEDWKNAGLALEKAGPGG